MAGIAYHIAMIVGLPLWTANLWFAQPSPSVDYVTQFNQLGKPDPYDESLNGATLFQKACAAAVEMPHDAEWRGGGQPIDVTGADLDKLRRYVKDNEDALKYLRRSAAMSYLWSPGIAPDANRPLWELFTSADNTAGYKHLVYAASARLRLEVHDGHSETLVDNAMDLGTCARRYYQPRTVIDLCLLVASRGIYCNCVLSALQLGDVPPEQLGALQQSSEKMATVYEEIERRGLEGERLITLDEIQRIFTDDGHGDGRIAAGAYFFHTGNLRSSGWQIPACTIPEALRLAMWHPGRKATVGAATRSVTRYRELLSEKPWQLKSKGQNYSQEFAKTVKGYPAMELGADSSEAMGKTIKIYHRNRAVEDGTVCAMAILRYKKAQNGLPDSLQDVVAKGYLKSVPVDPYSGKDMIYKKTADGFTLYSVGENFVDDGGVSNFGKQSTEGDDVYWPRFDIPKK